MTDVTSYDMLFKQIISQSQILFKEVILESGESENIYVNEKSHKESYDCEYIFAQDLHKIKHHLVRSHKCNQCDYVSS